MENKVDILVLFANAYDMKDGETGERISGTTVHYLFWGTHGDALTRTVDFEGEKPVGYQRAKVSLPYEARKKLAVAPAIYEGSFTMAVGSDGKPVLKLVDVAYKCNVDFAESVNAGFEVPGMVKPEEKGKK